MTPMQNVIVHQPEAAHQKGPLSGRQTISGIFGFVPQDKFVSDQQFLLNRSKSAFHPWIGGRQKSDERDQQQAGVQSFRAVGLHEAAEIAVEAALAASAWISSATVRQCR